MSIPHSREQTVFYAAMDVPDPAERRQFLDEACAGDSELRAAVEELLKAQADAEQFFAEGASSLKPLTDELESAAALAQDGAAFEEAPGTMLGRYKVIEKIGEGGFGVVYMAEQEEPVRRRVALKVIKLGMDTKSVIARFEAERQALAMMEHPNIARVFDAGATETGRPYFVMELVHGVKITDYCDRNQLGMEQRLELFIQVCQAIQHAHQKGIIHRDIKPTNILVALHDGAPMPKVIDFGIAKATEERLTDKTLLTAYAQFIGTPAYMSPEQMELSGLDLDTRSDIYSLGVLLYELLTGETPFDTKELLKSGVDEMRRTLRERDPTTPSVKLYTLSGKELETTAARRDVDPARLVSQVRGDLDWIVMKALEKDRTRRYETANGLAMDIRRYLDNEPVLARPPSRWYLLQKLVRRNRVAFASGTAVAAALLIGTVTSTRLYLQEHAALRRAVAAERAQGLLRTEAEGARAKEIELRQKVELRQKITQAALLATQRKYGDAEQLLEGIPLESPSKEVAIALRKLGDSYAVKGQWSQAIARFETLVKVDLFDSSEVVAQDQLRLASALIESGDLKAYERYRQDAVAQFASTKDPVADRVIKVILLLPAAENMTTSLLPQVKAAEKMFGGVPKDANIDATRASHALALALFEYRRQNYSTAQGWCYRCFKYREYAPPLGAAAHLVLAMSFWQTSQKADALRAWGIGREAIENRLNLGLDRLNDVEGLWFDWVAAQFLFRECEERFAETDRSVKGTILQPSREAAVTFRALGEWHALRQEWREASERFASLLILDQLDDPETASVDYVDCGITLIEAGDTAGYERFRQEAIKRFKDMNNKVIPERIINSSLLRPADEKVLDGLAAFAKIAAPAANADGSPKENLPYHAWDSMAMGLLEYRRGNYTGAADWCRRSLTTLDSASPPTPIARTILAMTLHQLGKHEMASAELQRARDVIESSFTPRLASNNQGHWRDWVFARIVLREATALIDGTPGTSTPAPR